MKPYLRMLAAGSRCLSAASGAVVKTRRFKSEKTELLRTLVTAPDSAASTSTSKKPKKERPIRPNYFVAVPINEAQIKEKLKEIQKSLVDGDKMLEKALVSLAKTHITLTVMHLKGQEQIKCASEALTTAISKIKSGGVEEVILNFEGVGHFKNEVLFARIVEDDGLVKLRQIAEIVRKTLADAGIIITDGRAFQAHLTIAKLSKNKSKYNKYQKKGVKKIDTSYYNDFEKTVFGQERCSKLQLLSMLKTDKLTGYYHCDSEALFSEVTAVPENSS